MTTRRKSELASKPASKRAILVAYFEDGRVQRLNPNRPRLLITFEMEHDGRSEPEGYEDLCWLLWHSMGRPGELDEFIDSIEEIDNEEEERGKAPR